MLNFNFKISKSLTTKQTLPQSCEGLFLFNKESIKTNWYRQVLSWRPCHSSILQEEIAVRGIIRHPPPVRTSNVADKTALCLGWRGISAKMTVGEERDSCLQGLNVNCLKYYKLLSGLFSTLIMAKNTQNQHLVGKKIFARFFFKVKMKPKKARKNTSN